MDRDAMMRMIYIRREYAAVAATLGDLQGFVFAPEAVDAEGEVWKGIVFVRSRQSPWFKGAFGFTVQFPHRYPFECPVATFDEPLNHHPLLKEGGSVIAFEAEYVSLDPMRVSVMLRLLRYIRRLFAPAEWPAHRSLNVAEMQQDVQACSITRDVAVRCPYTTFLTTEVLQWITEAHDTNGNVKSDEGGDGGGGARDERKAAIPFASWFSRTFLPATRTIT